MSTSSFDPLIIAEVATMLILIFLHTNKDFIEILVVRIHLHPKPRKEET